MEYQGHTPWKVKQLVIGERTGKRPGLPEHLTPQPTDSSRLLAAATEKNSKRQKEQIPAVSYRTVRRGDDRHV